MVAMIFRGKEFIIPHGDEILRPWDHIYVVTTRQNFDATLRFMGIEKQAAVQRAFIVGGGESAIAIAELLEEQGVAVKLFEQDAAQCEYVAGILRKSVVIHGDGSDQETLLRENVEGWMPSWRSPRTMIPTSSSHAARQLGARKVVALVNRVHNHPGPASRHQRHGQPAREGPRCHSRTGAQGRRPRCGPSAKRRRRRSNSSPMPLPSTWGGHCGN
jgi:hypothetical protein